jgi:hypothetical protein
VKKDRQSAERTPPRPRFSRSPRIFHAVNPPHSAPDIIA